MQTVYFRCTVQTRKIKEVHNQIVEGEGFPHFFFATKTSIVQNNQTLEEDALLCSSGKLHYAFAKYRRKKVSERIDPG